MPVYRLDPNNLAFPSPSEANEEGLLAVEGSLRPDWLLLAYESGIFPWYNEGDPILWWSPDPRCVLYLEDLKISRSMRPYLNSSKYEFKLDTAFEAVIDNCANVPRGNQDGTWLTNEMKQAYIKLHGMGVAHSAEIWEGNKLLGGLYGVSLGRIFFGESMFSLAPNMSKLALIRFCSWLEIKQIGLIDCQVYNSHLESLGAREIPRDDFLAHLDEALDHESIIGKWKVL